MILGDLQSRVRVALTTTIVDEWSLLSTDNGTSSPSERAVAFHLGWHLRPMIERTWDIDCEYNRSGMTLEDSVALRDGEGRKIPDLIVHRRGKLGPEHNLLLVAISTDRAEAGDIGFDRARALQQRFGYRYATSLNLRLAEHGKATEEEEALALEPHWQWATLEDGKVGDESVYPPDVLEDILARATHTTPR